MTKYKVKVWCPDCLYEDPLGCFDGGYDYIYESYTLGEIKKFDTAEEAEKAGWEYVHDGIWQFDVEDENGNVIPKAM